MPTAALEAILNLSLLPSIHLVVKREATNDAYTTPLAREKVTTHTVVHPSGPL